MLYLITQNLVISIYLLKVRYANNSFYTFLYTTQLSFTLRENMSSLKNLRYS